MFVEIQPIQEAGDAIMHRVDKKMPLQVYIATRVFHFLKALE